MKNSIEKDIEIINNFIAYFNKNIQNGYKADLMVLGEEIEALEHILSDYKKVVKENEELKEEKDANYLKGVYDERERWELKVNAQIKELKEKQKSNKNYNMADWEDTDVYTEIILNLQDLLEKRE